MQLFSMITEHSIWKHCHGAFLLKRVALDSSTGITQEFVKVQTQVLPQASLIILYISKKNVH